MSFIPDCTRVFGVVSFSTLLEFLRLAVVFIVVDAESRGGGGEWVTVEEGVGGEGEWRGRGGGGVKYFFFSAQS